MTVHRLKQRREAQKKRRRGGALNLVSLMDIFTILVFFLLVNSSEVEVLQTSAQIKLPDSTAEQTPETQLVISVSGQDIVVQGRQIASIAALRAGEDGQELIPGLHEELVYLAGRRSRVPEDGHEITILGDREIPYWLLRRIMHTCQEADFSRISLAVNRVGAGEEEMRPALGARSIDGPGAG